MSEKRHSISSQYRRNSSPMKPNLDTFTSPSKVIPTPSIETEYELITTETYMDVFKSRPKVIDDRMSVDSTSLEYMTSSTYKYRSSPFSTSKSNIPTTSSPVNFTELDFDDMSNHVNNSLYNAKDNSKSPYQSSVHPIRSSFVNNPSSHIPLSHIQSHTPINSNNNPLVKVSSTHQVQSIQKSLSLPNERVEPIKHSSIQNENKPIESLKENDDKPIIASSINQNKDYSILMNEITSLKKQVNSNSNDINKVKFLKLSLKEIMVREQLRFLNEIIIIQSHVRGWIIRKSYPKPIRFKFHRISYVSFETLYHDAMHIGSQIKIKLSNENVDVREKSVVIIQSVYRGHMLRKRLAGFLLAYGSALKIQKVWRGYVERRKYLPKLEFIKLEKIVKSHDVLLKRLVEKVGM